MKKCEKKKSSKILKISFVKQKQMRIPLINHIVLIYSASVIMRTYPGLLNISSIKLLLYTSTITKRRE